MPPSSGSSDHLCVSFQRWVLASILFSSAIVSVLATEVQLEPPTNLSAPTLARTASTVLLMWDASASPGIVDYEVLRDGIPVQSTERLSIVVDDLPSQSIGHFTVRARNLDGRSSEESVPVLAETKAQGRIFDIRDFGAVGDGVTYDTSAIKAAILACTAGGTVMVPAGVYSTDHFALKSDMTLYLAEGATLEFLERGQGDYPPLEFDLPGPDGPVSRKLRALISVNKASRVTVAGKGNIRGAGHTWYRQSGRPHMLQFVQCEDILVQGITLDDSPSWNTHALHVDRAAFVQAKFRKVSADPNTNGDGVNPESSRDVMIIGWADSRISLKKEML